MEHLNIVLPGLLVMIAFLLKLVVDRSVEIPNTIQAVIELPVDIVFLALTFSVAYTLTRSENQASGLFYAFVGIAFAIVIVLVSKKTQKLFISDNKWWILLIFINITLSGFTVVESVQLVIEGENIETTNSLEKK